MTYTLSKSGVKPSYENFLGENIFVVGQSKYEEKQYSFTTPSISNPAGNQVQCTLTFPPLTQPRIRDIYMTFTASNSSATLAPTFKSVFMLLNTVKLLVNNTEAYYYMDRYQIMSGVQDYLRKHDDSEFWQQLNRFRTETGKTVNGETIPTSGSQNFTIPLTVLFPFLKGMIVNKQITQLDFQVVWQLDTASLVNAGYVVSNTISNAYNSANLAYNNIAVNILWDNNTDARLYKNVYTNVMLFSKWETKVYNNQSWTNLGTDSIMLDLSTVWGKHTKVLGVLVFIQPSVQSAFNSATAAMYYSGANYIGFDVLSNSSFITQLATLSNVATASARRRYAQDFNKRRYGVEMPLDTLDPNNPISNTYTFETYDHVFFGRG